MGALFLLVAFLLVNAPKCDHSLVLASVVQGDAVNCNNLQWILFSLVVCYLWSSLQYDLLTKCYSKWHSDILCATPSCALNISILYIFFVSRNVKHVIILIAPINYHWATNFWSCFFYFDFVVFLDVFWCAESANDVSFFVVSVVFL